MSRRRGGRRVYTIGVTCTDSGGGTTVPVTVNVPRAGA
jgi:hypothetical protein